VFVEALTAERYQKSELLLFGTAASLRKKIPLGSDVILAGSSVVRDLGVMLNARLTMTTFHEEHKFVFFHLRRLRSVRQLLGRDFPIQLDVALVFSCLDYCNIPCSLVYRPLYISIVAASTPCRRLLGE